MKTEKKIEDYLHLYLGCKLWSTLKLCKGHVYYLTTDKCEVNWDDNTTEDFNGNYHKPILRPLSSISKIEIDEYIKASSFTQSDLINRAISDAEGTKYLLSKSFDLFNLIKAELAIDSTKITQP